MNSEIRVVGLAQALLRKSLPALTGLVVVVAMGIAADYAIGPVQAGTLDAGTSPPASVQASVVSAAADGADASRPAGLPNSDTDASAAQAIEPDPGKGFVRLPGHVLDVLAKASLDDTAITSKQSPLTLTLVLKRDDQRGFDRYLSDVYDTQSKRFRHFLTQQQITKQFGPSAQSYTQVLAYVRTKGFQVVQGSKNHLTITVRGSRAAVERAFSTGIADFNLIDTSFYANRNDPSVPDSIANHLQSVIGLSNLAQPKPVIQKALKTLKECSLNTKLTTNLQLACAITYGMDLAIYDLVCILVNLEVGVVFPAVNGAVGVVATTFGSLPVGGGQSWSLCNFQLPYQSVTSLDSGLNGDQESHRQRDVHLQSSAQSSQSTTTPTSGAGQKIGLVEFDSFNINDISDLLAYLNLPASLISNLSAVKVNGGTAIGSAEDEVLLDVGITLTSASKATTTVYEAPFTGAGSFQSIFNRMIDDGMTVISNSWAYCEDQTTLADVQSIDSILQNAAASGISVFSGAGDGGNTCLDGSPGVIAVPADSPHVTAVGGTTATPGAGFYGSETWWNGVADVPATGQGGFGVSKFFARPSYQAGFTSSTQRSIPDVVAAADPAVNGVPICQADNGGCPNGLSYGGTSAATPYWAAIMAGFNSAGGGTLGLMNPIFYHLASAASFGGFHTATSMGSDFAHVGLGSPVGSALFGALAGATVGAVDAARSGMGVVPVTVAADGTSTAYFIVQLRDANSASVPGKVVSLSASNGSHVVISSATATTSAATGIATFTVTDLVPEQVTFTATDITDGVQIAQTDTVTFAVPTAASGGITASPSTVPADGTSAATLIVTLKDSLGRATPGKTVTVSDAGAHAVITGPTPGVTDANGQIQFSATDDTDETVTFSAVDVTDNNLAIPGSGTVTYSGSTSTACGVGTVPVAGTGYTVTPYITGVPAAANLYYGGANIGCPGADNPAFTSAGEVLTADFLNGNIYQSGLSGGAVSTSNVLSTLSPAIGGLVYGKDGSAYATVGNEGAEIIQVDPTTGAQLRVVASSLTCPAGLSVDPLSGDLFFDDDCTGGGTDNASIFRVIDPADTDTSKPTSVVVYATLPATPNGGMAFAPNGTLYAVSGYYVVADAPVEEISGTNATTVTVTTVTGITSDFGVALGAANADDSAQSLIVTSSAGVMSEVPIASPSTATVLISANAPNPGVTGPDGCMYAAGHETIYKITSSTGSCSFTPTSSAPSISLSPATVSPKPAQGGSETFTATLKNVTTLSGVSVYFQITGANAQFKLGTTDANGSAAISYTAIEAGVDTVVATATASSTALTSNATQVTWTAGQHVTSVSLNISPQGGTVNTSVTVKASVTDVSASPAVSLAGQSVTFTLDGSSCTATTNSAGIATCTLTPTAVGSTTLTVSYAGSSSFTAAKESVGFLVSASPTPAPTVSISVSPATIVAGASATLTWSSTNATSCTASGSWSGSEATSGTQSVTPAVNGSYSYTLTCTGAGGTTAATAVLSATLVAVTVTAKSGGGALNWYVLLALGFLVMLRLGTAVAGSGVLRTTGGARRTRGKASSLVGVAIVVVVALSCVAARSARADQSSTGQPNATSDPYYVGIRVGSMPLRQDSTKIDQGLTSLGFPDVTATSDIAGAAGTVFLGYAFTPHAALELGYTFRDSTTAHLSGTIPSPSKLTPLLQDTTELTRGYGNIVSLSYSGRFEVLPRFSLEPRLGGFFWATKAVAITLDDRIDTTHEGGGVTAGLTAAYRLWRGLEFGVSVDYYRGFPNNIATLYAGTLEWRFGP